MNFLMEKLVRPALRAMLEAIDGIENATRGKTLPISMPTGFSATAFNEVSKSSPRPPVAFRRNFRRPSY